MCNPHVNEEERVWKCVDCSISSLAFVVFVTFYMQQLAWLLLI